MTQVASTRCRVLIVAPNGARWHFKEEDYSTSLMAVEVQKDMAQACGRFTLHFAPVRDAEGRHWHEIIPRRSLVFIDMERNGDPSLPEVSPTVMVGLTDAHSLTENWSEAHPRPHVQVSGRDIGGVLVDAHLVYSAALAADPSIGTMTMQSPGFATQQLALAWNPKLTAGNEDPRDILERILDYFLFLGGEAIGAPPDTPGLQQPIMQLDVPEVMLSDLLQKNREQWTLFDENARVPLPMNTADAGSLWNYLHIYVDRAFQEFFTRIEDGTCRVHFRGKPFRHERITSGTRFKTADEEPTLQTLALDPSHLLSRTSSMDTTNVYNYFLVSPLGLTSLFQMPNLKYQILPQVVKEWDHPSFVGRYGLRVMEVHSPYLAPFQQAPSRSAAGITPLTPAPEGEATYAPMANQIATAQGIPADQRPWFVALIRQESSFDPTLTSPKGAKGLAQLIPSTQALVGVTDPFDPVQSLTGGARYWNMLRGYSSIGNDPRMIVAAYNAGPGAVEPGDVWPAETVRHVQRVTSFVPRYQGMGGVNPTHAPVATAPRAAPPSIPGVDTAVLWASFLQAWYEMGGELFGGMLTVRGHPTWNIGHRLLSWDERGEWEAYIEGVSHQFDLRTGQYLTQLRYTRGWYLSAANAQQMWDEGQTTVTSAIGGPPPVDAGGGGGEVEVVIPAQPGVVVD